MTVSLRNLCLLCFFIPIITIIISFVWSANLNLISWCMPNFEGCTSISRVGRYEPVKYFFKPLMFIYAVSAESAIAAAQINTPNAILFTKSARL